MTRDWTIGKEKPSTYVVGDRVRVIVHNMTWSPSLGDYDAYNRVGTVDGIAPNRRDVAVRIDGQKPEEDTDVYKPEELISAKEC